MLSGSQLRELQDRASCKLGRGCRAALTSVRATVTWFAFDGTCGIGVSGAGPGVVFKALQVILMGRIENYRLNKVGAKIALQQGYGLVSPSDTERSEQSERV